MICTHCGNLILESRYGWNASTLCLVCLDQWKGEECELLEAMADNDEEDEEDGNMREDIVAIGYQIKDDGIYLQTEGLIMWIQGLIGKSPNIVVDSHKLLDGMCGQLVLINKEIMRLEAAKISGN